MTQSNGKWDVQLAATLEDATAATPNYIQFGQYPTINGIPITDVETGQNSYILFDFNPDFTEGQTVTFAPGAGQFLGYDNAAGQLVGPLSGAYKIHIVNNTVDTNDQYTIELLNPSNGSVVQLDDSPYLTTSNGTILRISSFDSTGNQLSLDTADTPQNFNGLHNGDAVVYHAGLATNAPGLVDDATYYAILDPSEFATIDPNNPPTLQLAATAEDAQAADPASLNKLPTLTWTDGTGTAQTTTVNQVMATQTDELIGTNHSFTITSSDPTINTLTISEDPGATTTNLTEGELLTYQGATGTDSTLQNGQTYVVHIISQVNGSGTAQVQLKDAFRMANLGTLSNGNHTFDLTDVDPNTNTVVMDLASGSATLQENESLTFTGASVPGGLQSGQSYLIHILDQSDPTQMSVQLTAALPITRSGILSGGGNTYGITASDPGSGNLTLAVISGSAPTQGAILTYTGPTVSTAGYLQTGTQYTVSSVTATGTGTYTVQLIATAFQGSSSGTLQGQGQSFTISSFDSSTGLLTIAESGSSELTSLSQGQSLTFQGTSGTTTNSLQADQVYTIAFVGSQANPQSIQIKLLTTTQTAGYGTLQDGSSTYIIHESDSSTGTLTIQVLGNGALPSAGDTIIFAGNDTGTGSGFLQNGQSYSVENVISSSDSNNVQVQLAQYLSPTYGTLTGTGHSFVIEGNDGAQTLTLSENAGATVPSLTEGETLTYTGSAISGTDWLQNGHTYNVHIIDQSESDNILVQLIDTTGGPLVSDSTTNGINPQSNAIILTPDQTLIPTGTIVTFHAGGMDNEIGGLSPGQTYQVQVDPTNALILHLVKPQQLTGTNQSYSILSIDGTNTFTLSTQPGTTATLATGQTLTYTGPSGDANSLQNGQTYTVTVISSSNPSSPTVQLKLGTGPALGDSAINTPISLTIEETFTDSNGHTYILTGANAYTHIVTVQEVGTSNPGADITNGLALTYHGAFGSSTGSLKDGSTYYVSIRTRPIRPRSSSS